MSVHVAARTLRVFFALWPSGPMRQALLTAVTEALPADAELRWVAPGNLHLTLAFLGAVAESELGRLRVCAAQVAGAVPDAPLILRFDRIDHWRRAQVLCATAAPAAAVSALADALAQSLLQEGFDPDRKPFRPHVTLARNVVRAGRASGLAEVLWSFTEFALIESRTAPRGSLYSVLDCWALGGGKDGEKSREAASFRAPSAEALWDNPPRKL